jgi:hypothetical protein
MPQLRGNEPILGLNNSSLTFPTSIHLSFLGFVPLRPTQRYSTFPQFEVLILLSRIVSSCNSEIYSDEKSSMEGI